MGKQAKFSKSAGVPSISDAYEPYVGRWNRLVGLEFVRWLSLPKARRWLDIGCATGVLTQMILAHASPASIHAVDQSEYMWYAARTINDGRATFQEGDVLALPVSDGLFDVAVSGLLLNSVPRRDQMVGEMIRAVHGGGTVAAYVWDYAGGMQTIRYFWDAAVGLNPAAHWQDEGVRFPVCQPDALAKLFGQMGLRDIETTAIDVPTVFRDFDDYWTPFLGGHAPAPDYCLSLNEQDRAELREYLHTHLPVQADGSIHLIARAWAVRGVKP